MDAFDAGLDDFVAHGGGAVETAICGELNDLPSQRGVRLQSAMEAVLLKKQSAASCTTAHRNGA